MTDIHAANTENFSEVSDHTALLAYLEQDNLRWNHGQDLGTAVVVSYSFTNSSDLPTTAEYNPFNASRYWAFSTLEQSYFRQALNRFEAVTGVVFVETETEAMVNVFGADSFSVGGWADYAYVSGTYTGSGNLVAADRDMVPGGYGFQILLHEMGHALGLRHPHDGGTRTLDPALDNPENTVMTYNNNGYNVTQLGRLDIDALEVLYGSASQTSGWNTYVANDDVITVTASTRSETIMATGQDTRILARGGNDTVLGRGGNDELNGDAGDDSIVGSLGEDLLTGGDGDDHLIGDLEDSDYSGDADTIFGGAGRDHIEGGGGSDLVNGGWARDVVFGGWGSDTLRGDFGADSLDGGADRDLIFGQGGRDDIDGGSHDDTIYGGNGGDSILGGTGNDIVGGGNGADDIAGQSGYDTVFAGAGNDAVFGGSDADVIGGGADNDRVNGGTGEDTIYGGDGADVLSGNRDADTIFGGGWADIIYGGSGDDSLAGGAGADRLIGGNGSDTLVGGAGADTFRFSPLDNFDDDTIRDFEINLDTIVFDFDGLGFDDLLFSTLNGNTEISGAGNLALTLLGVSASDLDANDFLFV